MPVENRFWGDRMGTLTDPFGHKWSIATHVEDVPPEQLEERMKQSSEHKQAETV
jgi:PhnB protein